MQKINIIQFSPYFPPHKWWVETVAEEIWINWSKNNLWDFFNVITDFEQEEKLIKNKKVIFENEVIWYKKDWYEVLIIPSFEIINNFPVYKIWDKKYFLIKKYLREKIWENNNDFRIFTHTRFFITSLIWWLFARKNNLKWIHIEHWSDYVKLSSKIKSYLSIIYDKIIWKWIFKKADKIVAISWWVKNFIQKEFFNREIDVIYNGINFLATKRQKNKHFIKIWFVWRLVKLKGVDLLIKVFSNLSKKYENIVLEIVWDGEEKQNLEKQVLDLLLQNKIKFLWLQNREYVKWFLANCDILVNPSFQEWLPTTVLEWLLSKCVVVASNVWWTREISSLDDLIIVEPGNLDSLEKWLEKSILNYKELTWKSMNLVLDKFDWNKNIEKYFNLYKKIIN